MHLQQIDEKTSFFEKIIKTLWCKAFVLKLPVTKSVNII